MPIYVDGNITEIDEFSSLNILQYSANLTNDNKGVVLNGLLEKSDLPGQIVLEVKSTSSPEILSVFNIIILPFGSKQTSSLSCFVSSTGIELDNKVTVSGTIVPAAVEVDVTLTYTRPDSTTLERLVTTSLNGDFNDIFTPSSIGAWSVQASWEGNDTHLGSSSSLTYFTVTKISTVLSCSVSPEEFEIEASVTVLGSISPVVSDTSVTLTYTKPDSSTLVRTVTSLSDGSYSDSFTPDSTGSWIVKASWSGDSIHFGDSSGTETFEVKEKAGIPWTLYGGVIAVIAVIAVVLYFFFIKKKIKL
jgi:hypothetical protein